MKNGGLGSLPRGLEWINQNNNQNIQKTEAQTPTKPAVAHKIENLTPPSIAQTTPISQSELNNQNSPEMPQLVASAKTKTPQKRGFVSASAGLPEGYTRATFIIRQDHIDRLKALAYVNKSSIKDLVDQAMTKFLKDKDVATILMEAVKGAEPAPENNK
jgi:hypothetical protein